LSLSLASLRIKPTFFSTSVSSSAQGGVGKAGPFFFFFGGAFLSFFLSFGSSGSGYSRSG